MTYIKILKQFNLSMENTDKLITFFKSIQNGLFYNDLEIYLKKEDIPFSANYIVQSFIENQIIIAAATSHGINIFIFKEDHKKGFIAQAAFSRLRSKGPEYHIKQLIKIENVKKETIVPKINISENINKFIELSKEITKENIAEAFKLLSLPFSNGSGIKEAFILELLYKINIYGFYDKNIGIVIPATIKKEKVVTSHIDLIPKFNKIFMKGPACNINKDIISGALDNTMTNTIALMIMINNPKHIEYTEFVFTEGEETDLHGMKNYLEKYGKNGFFINLDITSDNWDKNSSIEYDRPNYDICKTIYTTLDNPGITKDRDCDDFDEVDNANGFGFSYCIPSKKTIHSVNNYTLISKLEPYFNGLELLLKMKIKDKKYNIRNIPIKKAMKMKRKDFTKTMKLNKVKPTKSNGSYYMSGPNGLEKVNINKGIMTNENIFDKVELIENVLMENSIEFTDQFRADILASIEMGEGFTLETFKSYLHKDDFHGNVIRVLEEGNLIKVKKDIIYFY